MIEYVDVKTAIKMSGLRVVLTPGLPQPWAEAAKAILYLKNIPYTKVRQIPFGQNPELLCWTAQESAPVAVWNDEPPRSSWLEQLYLFERLAPNPKLIPEDFTDRVIMIGLAREICGERGYTWHRRHEAVRDHIGADVDEATRANFRAHGDKYGYTEELGSVAVRRAAAILEKLADQLEQQKLRGSRYFIGNSLTALDIYWACHAVTVQPLPQTVCSMPEEFRAVYTTKSPEIIQAANAMLLQHRDYIYEKYLELPLEF